jgi:hypothetical protein
MRSCLTNSIVAGRGDDMDHRYFFLEPNGRARYTCGLARQAMMEFFREFAEEGIFLSLDWHLAIRSFKTNPYVVGLMIEAVVIRHFVQRLNLCQQSYTCNQNHYVPRRRGANRPESIRILRTPPFPLQSDRRPLR